MCREFHITPLQIDELTIPEIVVMMLSLQEEKDTKITKDTPVERITEIRAWEREQTESIAEYYRLSPREQIRVLQNTYLHE